MRLAKRTRVKQTGAFDPTCFYTKKGLLRALGMGRNVLAEARQSGMVTPMLMGPKVVYDGAEIAEWLRTKRRLAN